MLTQFEYNASWSLVSQKSCFLRRETHIIKWHHDKKRITLYSTLLSKQIIAFYTLFHESWTSYDFNKNQMGTVSVQIITSVPSRNKLMHLVINKTYFPRDFKVSLRTKGLRTPHSCCLHSCFCC